MVLKFQHDSFMNLIRHHLFESICTKRTFDNETPPDMYCKQLARFMFLQRKVALNRNNL